MELNRIINDRIGLGKFQIRAFIILCLIDMNDGVQLVLSSFLNPIIKASFANVTSQFISSLASIFYIGILLGSFSSGLLADIHGRRKLIILGSIMQIIVALCFYLAQSLTMMFILRFFYGYVFGFTVAITTSMFAEITPEKYRGKGILLINFCISIGKLYGVFLGYIFIKDDLVSTNWKLMMICGAIPNVIVLLGTQFMLTQSPRFLLAHRRYKQAVVVLNRMIDVNHGQSSTMLSKVEEQQLQYQFSSESESNANNSVSMLFSERYLKYVVSLGLCWMIINFSFYGQLTIEALHLNGPKTHIRQNLVKYFFTVFGQIPSLFLTLFMIDHIRFGRKNSLTIFFASAGLFHGLFALTKLTAMGSIARFFMKDVFQILYPITTESFQTKVRTKGFGFCSGVGRVGSILMPFILIPLDEWSQGSVYYLFLILSFIATAIVWQYVSETMNINLDQGKQGKLLQENIKQWNE